MNASERRQTASESAGPTKRSADTKTGANSSSPISLLSLQRSAGNRATTAYVSRQRTEKALPLQRVGEATELLKRGPGYTEEETTANAGLRGPIRDAAAKLKKIHALEAQARNGIGAPDEAAQLIALRDAMVSPPPPLFTATANALAGKSLQEHDQRLRTLYSNHKEFCRRQEIDVTGAGDLDEPALAGRRVRYDRTPQEQAQTKVTISGGVLMRSATNSATTGMPGAADAAGNIPLAPVDTADSSTFHSGNGWEIFVVSSDGDIHMASHKIGKYHHSSLLAGGNVSMGGEMKVESGTIREMSNKTGHYQATIEHFKHFLARLGQDGVALDFVVQGFAVPASVPASAGAKPTAQQWLDSLAPSEKPDLKGAANVFEDLQARHGQALQNFIFQPPPAGLGWRAAAMAPAGYEREVPPGGGVWQRVPHDEARRILEQRFGRARKKVTQQGLTSADAPTITWE